MNKFNDKAVSDLFKTYPTHARKKLMDLRAIIFEVAEHDKNIGELEECLKWGEPAYVAKGGSTVRINWKASSPAQIFIYFNCKTTLVETFKELYGDSFVYHGNRALEFNMCDEIPVVPLKHCIALSLNYHRIKHLQLLGA
jgi:alpha-galactosidase